MKLYTLPGTCSLSCHVVLRWLGVAHEVIVLDSESKQSADYLALNPLGTVPTLVDGDFVLIGNVAILNYLADLHPHHPVGGGSPRARAVINRWLCFLDADMHSAFDPIFRPRRFLDDPELHEALVEPAKRRLRGMFEVLEQRLSESTWLGGEQLSLADPYLFVLLRWARSRHIDLNDCTHLQDFAKRMRADPDVRAAMQAERI